MLVKNPQGFYTRKSVVFILMFCACFLWGSAFSCVKIGYNLFGVDRSSPSSLLLFAGIRYILAGLLLLIPGLIFNRREFSLNRPRLKSISINTLFQVVLQYTFYYIGIAKTPGTRAAIINSTTVFISTLFAAFIFRTEKYTFIKAISSIIAVLSVFVLNYTGGVSFAFRFTAEGFILLSCTSAAIAVCLQRRLTECIKPAALCAYSFLLGGVAFVLYALLLGGKLDISSPVAYPLLVYLAFISSAAFTIQGTLLRYNPVSLIAVHRIMNPMIGVVISALVLDGELGILLHPTTLISLFLMIFAILLLRIFSQTKSLDSKNCDDMVKNEVKPT